MYRLSSLNFTEHDIAANISEVQEYWLTSIVT
jgi:hypothetical protein